ncbi:MAG TPA: DUF5677 domain-containing protein [Candidatus Angelobacter sp.]
MPSGAFVFGFAEEWLAFQQAHPKFVAALEPLAKTTEKAMKRVFNHRKPADSLVFLSGSVVHEDFTEMWVLAGNGLGAGASKIVRGMYERTVTAAYISRFPDEAKRFWDYGSIAHRRLINHAKEIYGTEQLGRILGEDHIQKVNEAYQKVAKDFREIVCAECGTDKEMFSWSKLPLPAMAKKAGYGLEYCYYNGYAWPTQQAHSTVLAISSRISLLESGAFFTRAAEHAQAALAAMMGHLLMLKMLRVQDSYFSLGLNSEIKEREAECKDAWPGIENDFGRGL